MPQRVAQMNIELDAGLPIQPDITPGHYILPAVLPLSHSSPK